jgi:hypothetical protein
LSPGSIDLNGVGQLATWLGIVLCLCQSAVFSGLNLAVFSLGRLQLEIEAAGGSAAAEKVLALRQNPNFVLTTILWGNVGINVLLTLLSDSVLAGVSAFLFSTVAITLFGEIMPQAYFSRNALKMASLFTPVLRFYQFLLYPVVKPSTLALDAWLGHEAIQFFKEEDLKEVIRRHMLSKTTDIGREEAIGALNFFTIDDLPIISEGTPVDPGSIIRLPVQDNQVQFPSFEEDPQDPFLRQVAASGRGWIIIVDERDQPVYALDADGFLRHALFREGGTDPLRFCHRPVVVLDRNQPLGEALVKLSFEVHRDDDIINKDLILVWGDERRIITGADLIGRLLRGIARRSQAEAV